MKSKSEAVNDLRAAGSAFFFAFLLSIVMVPIQTWLWILPALVFFGLFVAFMNVAHDMEKKK